MHSSFFKDPDFFNALTPGQQARLMPYYQAAKSIKKGQILQRKGDLHLKIYYVKQGCLRSYSIDDKGKEHVYMFAPEGWIVSDAGNAPGELFIDALENSEVEVFDEAFFDILGEIQPRFPALALERMVKRLSVLQKRIIMLMSATAWERYQHFLETYPNIIQRVPQRMVASYLGITPEALSKLRGDNAKK